MNARWSRAAGALLQVIVLLIAGFVASAAIVYAVPTRLGMLAPIFILAGFCVLALQPILKRRRRR